MELIVRQPQEGVRFLTAQIAEQFGDCILDNQAEYDPGSLTIIIDGNSYPILEPTGFSNGIMTFPVPSGVVIRAGSTLRLISNCSEDASVEVVALPIGLNISTSDATTCSNTSPVTASFQDRLRVFTGEISSGGAFANIKINGQNLDVADFFVQTGYSQTATSSGGDWSNSSGNSSSMFSLDLYDPTTTLEVTPLRDDAYFIVSIGYLEIIFAGAGIVGYINYLEGAGEEYPGITLEEGDVLTIESTVSGYSAKVNSDTPFVQISKTVQYILPAGGGSISPNPTVAGTVATWTLPTSQGLKNIGVQIGDGITTSKNVMVTACKLEADDKTASSPFYTNTLNNIVPELSGSGPEDCTVSGFRIDSLPQSCVQLKLNGLLVTLNQFIPYSQRANLRLDVSNICSSGPVSFGYSAISSMDGCLESDPATVTMSITAVAGEAEDDEIRAPRGAEVTVNLSENDTLCDGANTYFELVSGSNTNGTATIIDAVSGEVKFTPVNSAFMGQAGFSYNIKCGNTPETATLIDTARVDIFYYGASPADDVFTAIQDTEISGNVSINDTVICDQEIKYQLISGTSQNGSVTAFDVNTGDFTWLPMTGFVGEGSFQYFITCGGQQVGGVATVRINISSSCDICAKLDWLGKELKEQRKLLKSILCLVDKPPKLTL